MPTLFWTGYIREGRRHGLSSCLIDAERLKMVGNQDVLNGLAQYAAWGAEASGLPPGGVLVVERSDRGTALAWIKDGIERNVPHLEAIGFIYNATESPTPARLFLAAGNLGHLSTRAWPQSDTAVKNFVHELASAVDVLPALGSVEEAATIITRALRARHRRADRVDVLVSSPEEIRATSWLLCLGPIPVSDVVIGPYSLPAPAYRIVSDEAPQSEEIPNEVKDAVSKVVSDPSSAVEVNRSLLEWAERELPALGLNARATPGPNAARVVSPPSEPGNTLMDIPVEAAPPSPGPRPVPPPPRIARLESVVTDGSGRLLWERFALPALLTVFGLGVCYEMARIAAEVGELRASVDRLSAALVAGPRQPPDSKDAPPDQPVTDLTESARAPARASPVDSAFILGLRQYLQSVAKDDGRIAKRLLSEGFDDDSARNLMIPIAKQLFARKECGATLEVDGQAGEATLRALRSCASAPPTTDEEWRMWMESEMSAATGTGKP